MIFFRLCEAIDQQHEEIINVCTANSFKAKLKKDGSPDALLSKNK